MNLTNVPTFLMPLIKLAKNIVNRKTFSSCDTKQHMLEIAMKNGWSTQIVQILRDMRN